MRIFIIFLFLVLPFSVYGWQGEADIDSNNWKFPWCEESITVDFLAGFPTFVYTTAHPLASNLFGESIRFVYYDDEWDNIEGDIVVLDPDPPGSENTTFLDLHFNESLRKVLEDHLIDIVRELYYRGVTGVVLGDEWPRGLNNQEITLQKLSGYNQTYHDETGRWMRHNPNLEEKRALADWYYEYSIETWNSLANTIRDYSPDLYLGTNIDLVWEPDYSRADMTHWKESDWWQDVDLEPYDFVVTHYLTGMLQQDHQDPSKIDPQSLDKLRDALESLLNPAENLTKGRDVFLLLAAHCTYPYIITPMQMIQEWNTVLEFADRLRGVGWFTFDLWMYEDSIVSRPITAQSPAPMREDRLITIKWLENLNKYGACGGWVLGSQVQIRTEPENITLVEGDEIEIRLVIESLGWEGELHIHGIQWSPPQDMVFLDYYFTSTLPSESGYLGSIGPGADISLGIRLKAHKKQYPYDPVPGHLVFQISPSTCQGENGLVEMFSNEIPLTALEIIQELNLETYFFSIFPCEDGGYLLGGLTSFSDSYSLYFERHDDQGRAIWNNTYDVMGKGGWYSSRWIHPFIFGASNKDLIVLEDKRSPPVIFRIGSEGEELWRKEIEWLESVDSAIETIEGEFLILGSKHGGKNAHLVRLDSQCNLIWEESYGEGAGYKDIRLIGCPDGGSIIGGTAIGYGAGGYDVWVFKVDAEGNKTWERVFGSSGEERVLDMSAVSDGGFVMAGSIRPLIGKRKSCLWKLDSEGNLIWERTLGEGWFSEIVPTKDSGFFVYGQVGGWSIFNMDEDGNEVWNMSLDLYDGGQRMAPWSTNGLLVLDNDETIMRINSEGVKVWQKEMADSSSFKSVVETGDGGFLVIGIINYLEGGSKILLVKFDDMHTIEWARTFGNQHGCYAEDVVADDTGFTVLGGRTLGEADGLYLLRVSVEGERVWEKTINATDSDQGGAISVTQNGNFFVTGTIEGHVYLLGIDGNGTVLWERRHAIKLDTICGIARSNDTHLVVGNNIAGMGDVSLLMVGREGDKIWERTYDGLGEAMCLLKAKNGDFLIGGISNPRPFVLRINPQGDEVWFKTYSQRPLDSMRDPETGIRGIVESQKGGYLCIDDQGLMMKIDEQGDLLYDHSLYFPYPYSHNEVLFPKDFITLSSRSYIIVGHFSEEMWLDRPPYQETRDILGLSLFKEVSQIKLIRATIIISTIIISTSFSSLMREPASIHTMKN